MTYICREWFQSYHDASVEDEMSKSPTRTENSEKGCMSAYLMFFPSMACDYVPFWAPSATLETQPHLFKLPILSCDQDIEVLLV